MVERLTCVPELKLERGENVNYLGDELPEGAATVRKKRNFRNLHTADNFFSILTLFVHH